MRTLWMVVSNDKYELPLYVCDNAIQLAEKFNVTENSVKSSVSKFEHGVLKWTRFRRVQVEED